jgi:thiopeptide-type bacteriocin biosynthesis protein
MSNDILCKKLLPVLRQFNEATLLSWFFIRFRDTGYHIRLRLKINEAKVGIILKKLRTRLEGTINYHLIRDYQADTYRRELERYGTDMILSIEQFFHGSSELILNYIKTSSLKGFPFSYYSFAFVSVFQMLNSVIPDTDAQIVFLEQIVNAFYSEFSSDKSLKIDLDQKYREIKNEIRSLLGEAGYYSRLRLERSAELFQKTITLSSEKMSEFTVKRKHQLLADMIHMHLNRLFIDKQRNQELIVYYCLLKYVLSTRAINRKRS